MLRTLVDRVEGLVVRFPFTIAFCSFAVALALVLRPDAVTTASAPVLQTAMADRERLAAPVDNGRADASRNVVLPPLLWSAMPLTEDRLFVTSTTGRASVARARLTAQQRSDDTSAVAIQSLAAWSDLLTRVAATNVRPNQAIHDLTRPGVSRPSGGG